MALMAVLRSSSRCMASMLDFCTKKRMSASVANTATMIISNTVKPFLVFICVL